MIPAENTFKSALTARRAIINRLRFHVYQVIGRGDLTNLKAPMIGLHTGFEVNPTFITQSIAKENRGFPLNQLFRGGDWDRNLAGESISEKMKYKTISEILAGVPVEQSTEFQVYRARRLRDMAMGVSKPGPHNYSHDELIAYMEKLRTMYLSVSRAGAFDNNLMQRHPIKIGITREGGLVKLSDGNHRLALAHYIKIKRMPIQVRLIHSDHLAAISTKGSVLENLNTFLRSIQEKYLQDPVSVTATDKNA